MSKHIADKSRRAGTGERLKRYTEIERQGGGPRRQTRELQRRPRGPGDDGVRAREFLRIARGQRA